uniref:Polymerase nucleotidyl transferase domain-containing protein n=1 Tax=Pyramimonas obovata TaxID=1411642 RepID=A0A7S0WV47_9CHLO|mmetsp:Transcript_5152/g.10532  ORF Transcript_5152/g.10532 Transcript_5152/m.10532 type:complete len:546 (+) Transcript_5152:156-1793(+)
MSAVVRHVIYSPVSRFTGQCLIRTAAQLQLLDAFRTPASAVGACARHACLHGSSYRALPQRLVPVGLPVIETLRFCGCHTSLGRTASTDSQHVVAAAEADIQVSITDRINCAGDASLLSSSSREIATVDEADQDASQPGASYSVLHRDITHFIAAINTNLDRQREFTVRILHSVRKALRTSKTLKGSRVTVFGSRASQLALPDSDLDLLVCSPLYPHSPNGRAAAMARLIKATSRALQDHHLVNPGSLVRIPRARVPLVKFQTGPGLGRQQCDLSFATLEVDDQVDSLAKASKGPMILRAGKLVSHGGQAAQEWAEDQKHEFGHCLQALVLVLKALLNQHGLSDPSQGGLGGYSLLNMVVAYLRQESHPEGALSNTHDPDLGALLVGFLHKYGLEFRYDEMAISLEENDFTGEVPQAEAWWIANRQQRRGAVPLHIHDPIQPGHDIGTPSWNMAAVRQLFASAHSALADSTPHTLQDGGVVAGNAAPTASTLPDMASSNCSELSRIIRIDPQWNRWRTRRHRSMNSRKRDRITSLPKAHSHQDFG